MDAGVPQALAERGHNLKKSSFEVSGMARFVRCIAEPFLTMTTAASSQYLLLLLQPNTGPGPTPAELREIMARFGAWMGELSAKRIVVSTNGLEPAGKIVREPGGTVITDGPYAEAKEIVGGYILINAASLDEAVEIARGCPGLHYRLAVEVRPVKRHDGC